MASVWRGILRGRHSGTQGKISIGYVGTIKQSETLNLYSMVVWLDAILNLNPLTSNLSLPLKFVANTPPLDFDWMLQIAWLYDYTNTWQTTCGRRGEKEVEDHFGAGESWTKCSISASCKFEKFQYLTPSSHTSQELTLNSHAFQYLTPGLRTSLFRGIISFFSHFLFILIPRLCWRILMPLPLSSLLD